MLGNISRVHCFPFAHRSSATLFRLTESRVFYHLPSLQTPGPHAPFRALRGQTHDVSPGTWLTCGCHRCVKWKRSSSFLQCRGRIDTHKVIIATVNVVSAQNVHKQHVCMGIGWCAVVVSMPCLGKCTHSNSAPNLLVFTLFRLCVLAYCSNAYCCSLMSWLQIWHWVQITWLPFWGNEILTTLSRALSRILPMRMCQAQFNVFKTAIVQKVQNPSALARKHRSHPQAFYVLIDARSTPVDELFPTTWIAQGMLSETDRIAQCYQEMQVTWGSTISYATLRLRSILILSAWIEVHRKSCGQLTSLKGAHNSCHMSFAYIRIRRKGYLY
ncbi:hypothetical protein VFPPC_15213 [Pochonia chlamydosporia 170]|uniref:Uncharacterized protein n=1 Tax=Pochonia chlamydosporia 170 TaxID=1380566 RepID=A0A179G6A3_METCM|nr:hypothetical protein VFPPC_15213 [Pochonia chlamydosporia 170]OAQ72891.2 hypothetical protein VFPPC_15213 [Pochonia chlamydosporia 170]